MDVQQVIITPEDASHLMEKNIANRVLSPRRVNVLAQSITRGEWQFDGNPIRLTSDGALLDGQHRLQAIIQAGQSVEVLIIRGMAREAQLVIDSGRIRSFQDYLHMQGIANTLIVAAIVRLLSNLDSGNYYTGNWRENFQSNSALWAFYVDHRDEIIDAVSIARSTRPHLKMIPSVLGVLAILTARKDAQDSAEFFAQLSKRTPPSHAVLLLARTLDNRADQKADTGSREQRVELALGLKTWQDFLAEDDSRQILYWRRGEKFPTA